MKVFDNSIRQRPRGFVQPAADLPSGLCSPAHSIVISRKARPAACSNHTRTQAKQAAPLVFGLVAPGALFWVSSQTLPSYFLSFIVPRFYSSYPSSLLSAGLFRRPLAPSFPSSRVVLALLRFKHREHPSRLYSLPLVSCHLNVVWIVSSLSSRSSSLVVSLTAPVERRFLKGSEC